jgi:cyclophilin family peptidyl-prolyl cis-trans isomerase/HEAT repeat protein
MQIRAVALTAETPGAVDPITRIRRAAMAALVQSGAADATVIDAALRDADEEVRRLAMVGAAGDTEVAGRQALVTRGLGDAQGRVRYEALRAWGKHFQATSCEPVLAATRDRDPHVALLALDLLGAGCPDTGVALGALTAAVTSLPAGPGAWHAAAHGLVALAKIAPAEARKALPPLVQHPTWQVRMYAARAAAGLAALDELDRLGRDPHDNVRQAALDGFLELKRVEGLPLAYDALTRRDYQLVMTGAKVLGLEKDRPKATSALVTALARLTAEKRDTSRDPRVAILERLAETGAASDAAALQPYVGDPDPRVAYAARVALARWTGAAAPPPLAGRTVPPRTGAPIRLAGVRTLEGATLAITMARGGTFTLRLLPDQAPATVLRVAALATAGHYDGLTFHRVVPNFVIQGGSPGANEFMGDAAYMRDEPILAHRRGTVGISTRGRDTGDAQIFVNLVDLPRLDHQYTVFAEVVEGMDVVDGVLEGDVMTRVVLERRVPAPQP